MSKETDLRILKTRKAIELAFTDLITVKTFKEITINDISNGALINRSTFYLHYTDKYDLLDSLVNQKIAAVVGTVSPKTHIKNDKMDYSLFTSDLSNSLKIISEEPRLYEFMLNDPESLGLRKRFEQAVTEKLSKSYPPETPVTRDLLVALISSMYISVTIWWLNNGMKYSAQFLASELARFFELGAKSLLD